MQESYENNIASTKDTSSVKIIQTDINAKNGQNKCPKCGATDISINVETGRLRCNFCRNEFEPIKVEGFTDDISNLKGKIIGSGAKDIVEDTNSILTFKCSSCGAEVVIDTNDELQARCHWCRNTLSVNQQIPNGAVPDVVLPFAISKEMARNEIETFVKKRNFFANPKFKKEFTTENIMGVYFPYLLVDINAHANFMGEGEHEKRKYYVGSDENKRTYYDADLYHVERDFDITIEGLSIESSKDKLNTSSEKTTNIINSIMPFDTENCVKWNANYLKGYTSEKRDVNVSDLHQLVGIQARDIIRFSINGTLSYYDRGVSWKNEYLNVIGEQWKSAYLPVWLYSYQEKKGNKSLLHYVAVNARTKEVMGSVPIHIPKLLIVSALVETVGFFMFLFIEFDYNWIFLLVGIIYFFIMYSSYRNSGARHKYEKETKTKLQNLKKVDNFLKTKKGLTNSTMIGANNKSLYGKNRVIFNKISK